jgi:hypothetical protein
MLRIGILKVPFVKVSATLRFVKETTRIHVFPPSSAFDITLLLRCFIVFLSSCLSFDGATLIILDWLLLILNIETSFPHLKTLDLRLAIFLRLGEGK